jgi:hypothetical protein
MLEPKPAGLPAVKSCAAAARLVSALSLDDKGRITFFFKLSRGNKRFQRR